MQAQASAATGDTVYLRGGTYRITPNQISRTVAPYAYVNYLDKNGVSYLAYPGETPIFDFTFVTRPNFRITAFYVRGSNIHLKGFEVIGVQVTILVHTQSENFRVEGNNNTLELLKAHDGMANGIYVNNHAANNLILNCDCYNNWDSVSEAGFGGNVDGFGCHSTGSGNIFRQCRSWNNSDDGFDCINCAGSVTFDHCWSYSNGKRAKGDGNGFKVGGWGTIPRRFPCHCLCTR